MRGAIQIAALCAAALWVCQCGSCEEERDDVTRIRELIEKGAKLASERNIRELMALTSDDFKAAPGSRDRRATKGLLFVAFQKYQNFTVHFPRPQVAVDPAGQTAEASTPFLIVREGHEMPDLSDLYDDPQGWLSQVGDIADPYFLDLELKKEDGQWWVSRAKITGTRGIGNL